MYATTSTYNTKIKPARLTINEKSYFFVEIIVESDHIFECLQDLNAELLLFLLE